MSLRPVINALALIEEVKKRPCLYDSRFANGCQDIKTNAWNEVGTAMFPTWKDYDSFEKNLIVKEMQTKWKSVRDNFSRQLRVQAQVNAGIIAESPRKYLYTDHLSFLTNFIKKRDRSTLNLEEGRDSDDSAYEIEETKPICTLGTVETVQESTQPIQFVPIQSKSNFAPTAIDINALSVDGGEPALKKVARSLEDLVAFHKEEKSDDPMGNRKFLLSLLPFMKKLPDDVNLEVRLQLMSVLQTYRDTKGFH